MIHRFTQIWEKGILSYTLYFLYDFRRTATNYSVPDKICKYHQIIILKGYYCIKMQYFFVV
jgi:hypothetical protein